MKDNSNVNETNESCANNINEISLNQNNVDESIKAKKKYSFPFLKKIQNKLIKIYNEIHKNKKNEIIVFVLSVTAIILYYLSLNGCYGDEVYCLAKLGLDFYLKIIIICSISSIFFCIVLILVSFKKASIFHLFYLIPSLIILMISDQGSTLSHHGYFNTLGYITSLIIFFPILSFIFLMIKLIKKNKILIYMPILFILFCLLLCFIVYVKINTNCDGWDIGLNNTRIYNNKDEYACQIKLPKSCYINLFNGKLNISNIVKRDCKIREDNEKKMLFEYIGRNRINYISPNTKRIGYPNFNKGKFIQIENDGAPKLSKDMIKNLVDMDNLPPDLTPEDIPEVYVDFTDYPDDPDSKYGKIIFNLTRNETLVKERKKKEENNEVMFNNIIEIFLDTVSRANFIRKMPILKAWLEKYMKYDSEDFINYQFLKFHSLGVHTILNIKPAVYGESILSPNGINILNYLHEKGFISAQADNFCGEEPYDIHSQSLDQLNVTLGYYDHELISLFCDPNYYRPENPFYLYRGYSALMRRCFYGNDSFDYILNYSKLFWKTYKGSRRFLRLSSMDSHEATGELISLFDRPLTNFLDELYKNGDLNDTIIFLFSDHGNHMSPHLSLMPTDDLEIEKIMPFFFILVPKKSNKYQNKYFLDEFYDNLYKNQQSFVNCYDIHDTIIHIIYNEFEKNKAPFSLRGTSLFKKVDDKYRTCDDFPEIYKKKSPGTLTCACINNKRNIK